MNVLLVQIDLSRNVGPMNWFVRSLISLMASTLIVGVASTVAGFDGEGNASTPSCVHETVYEPFAGLVLVSVTIAGSPQLDFVVDSGATSSSVTDPLLAWALGLEVKNTGLARGVGSGAKRVTVAKDVGIQIDGVEVLRTPLVVHDIGTRLAATAGREIHGFLGADLFERFVVEINPLGHRLLLHDPETFDYQGPGIEVPLEVVDRRPVVRGSVVVKEGGKEVPVKLVADTGSGRFLALITKRRCSRRLHCCRGLDSAAAAWLGRCQGCRGGMDGGLQRSGGAQHRERQRHPWQSNVKQFPVVL